MKILVFCDGSVWTEKAVKFLLLLNYPADTEIVLCAIDLISRAPSELMTHIEKIRSVIASHFLRIQEKVVPGTSLKQLGQIVEDLKVDLVVLGEKPLGSLLKQVRRREQLSYKLSRIVLSPFLVVRDLPETSLQRVLICTSADQVATQTLKTGVELLRNIDPDVHLLHVMSQVALTLKSPSQDLFDTAESAMARGTREGIHFREAIELLRRSSSFRTITPRLRHGLVLDEVLAEIREQSTQLLVIGSHIHIQGRRLTRILTEDVASDLLREAPCSVLIVA